jgi:hypothetical protein
MWILRPVLPAPLREARGRPAKDTKPKRASCWT